MILLHGTTLARATSIAQHGPNPAYQESGGQAWDDGFSLCVANGPFPFGHPEEYARNKARNFPSEGGPVILEIDVPEMIVQQALNEFFPLSQGLVQFDAGGGLEELLAAWATLSKTIRSVV